MVCACMFVVSKDLCGIGILCLGFIHLHRGLSSGPGLTSILWHHAGVCAVVLWPPGLVGGGECWSYFQEVQQ